MRNRIAPSIAVHKPASSSTDTSVSSKPPFNRNAVTAADSLESLRAVWASSAIYARRDGK